MGMMIRYIDRVMQLITASDVPYTFEREGTNVGARLTLGNTVTGYRSFADSIDTEERCYYCLEAGAAWEVGVGFYVGENGNSYLMREEVLDSTNGGSYLTGITGDGQARVFVTLPAARIRDHAWDVSSQVRNATSAGVIVNLTASDVDAGTLYLPMGDANSFKFTRDLGTLNEVTVEFMDYPEMPALDSGRTTLMVVYLFLVNPQSTALVVNMPSGWNWGTDYVGPPALTVAANTTMMLTGMTLDNGATWMGAVVGRGW